METVNVEINDKFLPTKDKWGSPLTWEKVDELRLVHGKNIIELDPIPPWWKLLYNSSVHPFNILLVLLAIVAIATQDFQTPIILSVMIIIGVGLRFIQERKYTIAAQSLKNMVQNKTTVIRYYNPPDNRDPTWDDIIKIDEGVTEEYEINIDEIVPGDIIKLSAGDMIPGDIQLIQSKDLFISQSMLTGESIPVEKMSAIELVEPTEYNANPENNTLCFMGTSVVSGTAKAVVYKTGINTMLGKLAKELSKKKEANAFQKDIKRLSLMFIGIMLVITPIVFLINGFITKQWLDSLLFSIAIAVGLTPEMLPMIINGTLAHGSFIMARSKTIVKELDSIVNLGSMDVLCTDKTGTLTQDKVVLIKHLNIEGNESKDTLHLAFLNSYHQTGLKNLLDLAVIEYFKNTGDQSDLIEHWTKVDEIPFDFIRRRISILLRAKDNISYKLVTKGAVEEILKISTHYYNNDQVEIIDQNIMNNIHTLVNNMNLDGLRVIAVAMKDLTTSTITDELETQLILMGFVAFLDPPKDTCAAAIKKLTDYGINIKVLTGDSPLVCKKICEQVNLTINGIVTSDDLKSLDDDQFKQTVENTTIFAKLTPLEKAKVVKVLKQIHVVGFMGDGINDALAIKEADVGISVDTGVDVAKEAAKIIMLEKSLLVLVKGVIIGRNTCGNTMKYIKMAISSNFGNVFSVLVASTWLPFLPMLPIHLLVQNLLYDISQIAIPWDKMDPEYLLKPSIWRLNDLFRFMIFMGPISSIFDITLFSINYWFYGWNQDINDYASHFQTGWFMLGLLTQTSIVHMIRTPKIPFLQSRSTLPLLFSTLLIMSIALMIPLSPVSTLLQMSTPPSSYYPIVIGLAICYMLLSQIGKYIYINIFHSWI